MLNPNSFLTRHLRWGFWVGIPWWLKELLAASVVLTSGGIILGGTLGAFARARGPFGVLAIGTVLYTMATITLMYGMTRFRLPLEPLWMVYLTPLLVRPRDTLAELGSSMPRAFLAVLTLPPMMVRGAWPAAPISPPKRFCMLKPSAMMSNTASSSPRSPA